MGARLYLLIKVFFSRIISRCCHAHPLLSFRVHDDHGNTNLRCHWSLGTTQVHSSSGGRPCFRFWEALCPQAWGCFSPSPRAAVQWALTCHTRNTGVILPDFISTAWTREVPAPSPDNQAFCEIPCGGLNDTPLPPKDMSPWNLGMWPYLGKGSLQM